VMLVDFVFLCPSKKNFVRFVLGNRGIVRTLQTKTMKESTLG